MLYQRLRTYAKLNSYGMHARIYRGGYWFSLRRYTSRLTSRFSARATCERDGRYPIEVLVSANRADVTYDRNVSRVVGPANKPESARAMKTAKSGKN